MRYKLRTGCYYYQIGTRVYLRNVDLCKDFLFEGIAYEILDLLAGPDGASEETLISEISELYQVSAEILQEDVRAFLIQLLEQDLLEAKTASNEGPVSVVQPTADVSPMSVANQILGACMAENQLFSVSVELTYRCNERCVHCYVDDAVGKKTVENTRTGAEICAKRAAACMDTELSCEEYKAVFAQLRELGCVKILLTGGEVLLREDFLQIVSSACELGLLTDIYTNGYLLTQELLDELHRMKINSLSFSLYGGTADIHDAITGIKGSFNRTLRAIRMTKSAGIDTYIKTVVLNQNVDDMESLLQIGKSMQVDVTPSYTILDTHRGTDNTKYRVTNPRTLQKVMGLFRQYEPHLFQNGNKSAEDPICSIGKSSLHINPYGDIMPCMTVPMTLGNIREDQISDIWEHNMMLKRLRTLRMKDVCPSAADCKWVSHCTMCLGRCDVDSEVLLMPKDICAQARAAMQCEAQGN